MVHGADGTDEVSLTGKTQIIELRNGKMRRFTLVPKDFGLPRASLKDLKGGTADENAEILKGILSGEKNPVRNFCVINAAAALVVSGKASMAEEGVELAQDSLDSGRASQALEKLITLSNSS